MRRIAFYLVWAFVFTVPWQNVLVIPGVGTIAKLLGIIAFAVGGIAVLTSARMRPLTSFHYAALAFIFWGCLSFYWSVQPAMTHRWIGDSFELMALAWLIWEIGGVPKRREALLQAYVLGAFVAAFSTINSYRLGTVAIGPQTNQRFGAGEFNVNDLGFLLAVALPMAWHFSVMHRNTFVKWGNRLYLPIGMLAIVLTASRGALVVAVVGCAIILPSTFPRLRQQTRVAIIVLLVLSVGVALRFAPTGALDRLATTKTELTQGDLNDRMQVWKAAFALVPEHPVLGTGAGTFKAAVRTKLGFEKSPHNAYIGVLAEMGMVGFLCFLLMFLTALRHALRSSAEMRPLALALLVALAVGLLPRGAAGEKSTWLLFAFTLSPMLVVPAAVPGVRRGSPLRPGMPRPPGAPRVPPAPAK